MIDALEGFGNSKPADWKEVKLKINGINDENQLIDTITKHIDPTGKMTYEEFETAAKPYFDKIEEKNKFKSEKQLFKNIAKDYGNILYFDWLVPGVGKSIHDKVYSGVISSRQARDEAINDLDIRTDHDQRVYNEVYDIERKRYLFEKSQLKHRTSPPITTKEEFRDYVKNYQKEVADKKKIKNLFNVLMEPPTDNMKTTENNIELLKQQLPSGGDEVADSELTDSEIEEVKNRAKLAYEDVKEIRQNVEKETIKHAGYMTLLKLINYAVINPFIKYGINATLATAYNLINRDPNESWFKTGLKIFNDTGFLKLSSLSKALDYMASKPLLAPAADMIGKAVNYVFNDLKLYKLSKWFLKAGEKVKQLTAWAPGGLNLRDNGGDLFQAPLIALKAVVSPIKNLVKYAYDKLTESPTEEIKSDVMANKLQQLQQQQTTRNDRIKRIKRLARIYRIKQKLNALYSNY